MEPSGIVRDAIIEVLESSQTPLRGTDISALVSKQLGGSVAPSSVRSSLQLQSKKKESRIIRVTRGVYGLRSEDDEKVFTYGNAKLIKNDAFSVMASLPGQSVQAIVTDPPYGLVEYEKNQMKKMRAGRGGVWRIPPSFDGAKRNPVPRFTTLTDDDKDNIYKFFETFGEVAKRILVPGANVVVASNPLVCHIVADALASAGLEPRGQIVRLVQTMRGGDRPKGYEKEYPDVSVMPRSQFEPWIIMRMPISSTVGDNLKQYGTGGWRRIDDDHPFGDVIKSSPARKDEREIANHPSLKPQRLMRQIVRGALPLGEGTILDPFAGSGSTLAAAEAVGYKSIGVEHDDAYFRLACDAIPKLSHYDIL